MKLREVLNNIHYGDMTKDELLDLEVKQELRYSSLKHEMVPAEKNGAPYILLKTTMIP